jgi:tetratricopeptide (TPR) repeat protein
MSRQRIAIVLVCVLGALGALAWMALREPRWTTSSAAARVEFEAGLAAELRLYHQEAAQHYERAVALDPQFAMARLRLSQIVESYDREAARAAAEPLARVDRARLTEREVFLLDHFLARRARENASAENLLTAYLERNPKDPFALHLRCSTLFASARYEEAEACLKRLLEYDPNWVVAQNQLGYIAMAQGRFAQAEEHFRTYAFIAPDQANPHDSLAELLILIGRTDEGRQELEKAVAIRPDFCVSWRRLVDLRAIERQAELASAMADRMESEGRCRKTEIAQARCSAAAWDAFWKGAYALAWDQQAVAKCWSWVPPVIVLRSAVLAGRSTELDAIRGQIRDEEKAFGNRSAFPRFLLSHLEGVDAAARADWVAAEAAFRRAEEAQPYWIGDEGGLLKLANRLDRAQALERQGKAQEAAAVRAEVRSINADFARRFSNIPLTAAQLP